jgi:hypothetical protein
MAPLIYLKMALLTRPSLEYASCVSKRKFLEEADKGDVPREARMNGRVAKNWAEKIVQGM